jgi:hypothetical protein
MTGDLLLVLLVLAGLAIGAVYLAHLLDAIRAWWLAWRRRIGTAVVIAPFLVPGAAMLGAPVPWYIILGAVAVAGALVWRRFATTASKVTRWSERTRRKSGVASTLDVTRHASTAAVRRTAGIVRPSLADLPRRERRKVATSELATLLVTAGGQKVWSSVEDVKLVFGGPRFGKSGWLASRIAKAPGAALVTSTRTDLYTNTAHLRPGPTLVFNAAGVGGLASTLTFCPLIGCEDPTTASARAADLLPDDDSASGDRRDWNEKGRAALAMYLHAAALGDRTMHDVSRWVAVPDRAEREVLSLLRLGGGDSEAFGLAAVQFVTTNDRTRSSITSAVSPALRWLTSPAAAAAAKPGAWTVEALLASRTTVYLLGGHETQSAPLVAALVGHIAREARRIAALQPAGRLDPPFGLYLDEASQMAPDALIEWSEDMGGRGGEIVALFQSRAQLLRRWGRDSAATILNNAGAIMLFGGTTDRDDLDYWSGLGGERDEPVTTTDEHGRVKSATTRKVRVLQPAEIRKLPRKRAIVFVRGLAPIVGRARMVWEAENLRAAVASSWAGFVSRCTGRIVTPAPAVVVDERPLAELIPLRPRNTDDADSGVV